MSVLQNECIAKISGTAERLTLIDTEAKNDNWEIVTEKQKKRLAAFRFDFCGIKPGEKIVYIKDGTIQPTVVDERKIRWDGQITSLSALAQKLLGVNHPVQGTLYFAYNGIVLAKLRETVNRNTCNPPIR